MDDKKYRVPLKKVYSVLSEAYDQALYFSDLSQENIYDASDEGFANFFFNHFIKHLAVGKICCYNGGIPGTVGCLTPTNAGYSGNECFPAFTDKFGNSHRIYMSSTVGVPFVLKDGTSVVIFQSNLRKGAVNDWFDKYGINNSFREGFKVKKIGNYDDYYAYFYTYVDVNGKNGPNVIGKDVHFFIYTKSDGLIPGGTDVPATDTGLWSSTYNYINSDN